MRMHEHAGRDAPGGESESVRQSIRDIWIKNENADGFYCNPVYTIG